MSLSNYQIIKNTTIELISEIFKISLVSYLVFYLIEDFFPKFVSDFFNMNIVLGLVVASGVLTIIFNKRINQTEEVFKSLATKNKLTDYLTIIVLSFLAAGLIYYKTKEMGKMGLIVSMISGIIILLMSILLLNEDEKNKE